MPEQHKEKDIIGWCSYCKDEILDGDPYIVVDEDMYHLDCHKQMNTFYDPLDD